MITAKPKINTLFSLGLFIVISLGIAIFTATLMLKSAEIVWYQYLIVIFLFPLALGLMAKVIFGYKVIEIRKERIDINSPTKFKKESYKLKDIDYWKETRVKTATGTYKELEIRFQDNKKLILSYQEHTDYIKVISYLRSKAAKKMQP